jgi:DNA-binding XRE family transcriptional regulator
MKIPSKSAAAIGKVVRSSRKAQNIRQDDAAGTLGVGESLMEKIERGGETVQWLMEHCLSQKAQHLRPIFSSPITWTRTTSIRLSMNGSTCG